MKDDAIDIGAIRVGFVDRTGIPPEARDRALAALSASWTMVPLRAPPTLLLAWQNGSWALPEIHVAPGESEEPVRARAVFLLTKAGFGIA